MFDIRRFRILVISVLLTLVLSAINFAVRGQGNRPDSASTNGHLLLDETAQERGSFQAPIITSEDGSIKEKGLDQIADRIVVGLLSEKSFLKLDLSDEQVVQIFKRIRDARGWQIDDEALAEVAKIRGTSSTDLPDTMNASAWSCSNQALEMESGSRDTVYLYRRTSPNGNECGTDRDDTVLEYRPRWGPYTNPDCVKWWCPLWYVRWVIYSSPPVGFYGRLSANGFCTTTIRVCVGSRVRYLGNDLNYIYLWHK